MMSVLSATFGQRCAETMEAVQILRPGVTAAHARQHRVRAGLHRQMEMFAEISQRGEILDQFRRQILRVRRGEADTAQAVDRVDPANNSAKLTSPGVSLP